MAEERIESEETTAPVGRGEDAELALYRDLVKVPDVFEDGFTSKTVLGALFVGLIMIPASIYLGLVVGQDVGAAAQWVTVILFTEVARRSFVKVKKQEVFILIYIAGAIVAGGGPFAGFIWNQYLIQSPAAKGFQIAHLIPSWVVPNANSPAIVERTFLHRDWLVPVLLMLLGSIIGRMQWLGLGSLLFRVTSDIERLPFPMAPVQALGATALAEHTQKNETWRWHVFCTGSVIGISWAFFYAFGTILTGAVLTKPIQLIPIPWIELTNRTEKILPGAATGISTDAGLILTGFVVPFWGVIGQVVASFASVIINPQLQRRGLLPHWEPGADTVETSFAANRDFWLAVGIGVTIATALIGFYEVGKSLSHARRTGAMQERRAAEVRRNRGDWPAWMSAAAFTVSVAVMIVICLILIPNFPKWWLFFFGFLYTPIMSYISARLFGLIGQGVDLPMVREMSFILSGYRGVDIWFAPIPLGNMGGQAQFFRATELTGTKMTSILKAEALTMPLVILFSFIFWQFIWRLAPIPSNAYPFAQKMWPLNALNQCLWNSATTDHPEIFLESVQKPYHILGGLGFALFTYTGLTALRLPTLFVWGVVRGVGTLPHGSVLLLLGSVLSRFYFEPRYGKEQWRKYAPVLAAGFACGTGLIGMAGAALAMVIKSVRQVPY